MVDLSTEPGPSTSPSAGGGRADDGATARPTVTIGLPVYNGERFVEQSVRSILDQDFADLELIVADNASTDRTIEIVREAAGDDPRVTILPSDTNHGAAWNYNRILDRARGRYFRWHAHDDPGAVLAHSWTRFVDDDGATEREFPDDLGASGAGPDERLREVVVRLTYCNPVFGLIRTEVLQGTARIASFPGSDATLLYELAMNGRFAVVPELLYNRRPGNSIKTNNSMKAVAEWFAPSGSGGRLPALAQFNETMRALGRAPLSTGERARCAATFVRHWPVDYARKSRRRARRRRQRQS